MMGVRRFGFRVSWIFVVFWSFPWLEIGGTSTELEINEGFNRSICGPDSELHLQGTGFDSALILSLDIPPILTSSTCKLRITAPDTHIISISLIEDLSYSNTPRKPPRNCPLSVYLPENRRTIFWSIDPCSQKTLLEGTLVTQPLRLVWSLPQDRKEENGRKVVLTALGQGDVCKSEGQHTCMRVGWTPTMCVADELVCDGIIHCPATTINSDEDHQMCKERKKLQRQSWEKIAQEFFKKFTTKNRPNPALGHDQSSEEDTWLLAKDLFRTSTESVFFNINIHKETPAESGSIDSFNNTLHHYGPWGYLMLAMLICGTVLMFCGMWECCCRNDKPPGISSSPGSSTATTAVVHQNQLQPGTTATTVLIINQSGHEIGTQDVQGPPNYEDLDQPPSYSVLFPGNKQRIVRQMETVA